jgi:hypothetical protein
MENAEVKNYIIKIVGLLGEVNPKKDFPLFLNGGYTKDLYPVDKQGVLDNRKAQGLRDYFYPNFRNIMFLDDTESGNYRFTRNISSEVELYYKKNESRENSIIYTLTVISSEIYVFDSHFGLFSLSLKIKSNEKADPLSLDHVSNITSIIRNFHSPTVNDEEWHRWITDNILCGKALRGDKVKADEYSGSKFKLYTILDVNHEPSERSNLLFDIATISPLGSGEGKTFMSPDRSYFDSILSDRIAIFKNWEALALFDSFTSIGQEQLVNPWQYESWNLIYFRIYLYRLFFKYNLFRYNSEIHSNSDNTIKLRDEFEKFLNRYNISHISFNFLGNEIFKKAGQALELDAELNSFRETINNLSKTIQEEKQAKTNVLLQGVTILTSITSIGPIFDLLQEVETYLGWSDSVFYSILSILIVSLGVGVLLFITPERFMKLWKKIK